MLDKLCTLCAAGSPSKLLKVSDSVSEECRVDSLITKYLHIEIQSNYVCSECFAELEKFHKYYKRIHELQKKFSFSEETRLISTHSENKVEDVQNSSTTHCNISFVKEEPVEIFDVIDQMIRIDSEKTKSIDCKEIDEDYYEVESKNDLHHNQEEKMLIVIPLTAAEKQRRYREKLKQDKKRYEESKNKALERYHKNKTLVVDMTERDKRRARKRWRKLKQDKKLQEKNLRNDIGETASPSSSEMLIVPNFIHQSERVRRSK